jgi:mycothiol system anti-sigma-R factor
MSGADRGSGCRHTLEQIERYLDGELDPDIESLVQHHLSGCNPCMQKTEFRQHVKELIQSKCAQRQVPDGLWEKVRTLMEAPAPGPPATNA